jgi:exodeoxyribonuclease-5
MLHPQFRPMLLHHFQHTPTTDQVAAVDALEQFLFAASDDSIFCLRGYAGTGKTSLVAALVRTLQGIGRKVVLLAPTGRAAKVLSSYAGMPAYTIHKMIYRQETFKGEDTRFQMGYNKNRGTLFVVDEASMMGFGGGGNAMFGSGCLMDDLVRFVYEGSGCRLLMVGDTAQLPPVGEEESPALIGATFRRYGLEAIEAELTEVVRQASASGVLTNATQLRQLIAAGDAAQMPAIYGGERGEVRFLPADELIEALVTNYSHCGADEVVVVTRSNRRANIYNQGIRARIFDREEELSRGDRVMAVKNNYYWTETLRAGLAEGESLPFDFIANGDMAEVVRLRNIHEQHGFRFADATLRFVDYGDFEMECRVILSTLTSESPSLTSEESQRLYDCVLQDYKDIPSQRERMQAVRRDPYYNALQIKFAYALTCHKAQGGQWERVFIDKGVVAEDTSLISYLRWLYTALTRTTDRVYLVNWPKSEQIVIEEEDEDC